MRTIAILTPDPADEAYAGRWRDVLDRNCEPLRRAGAQVESRSWAEAQDLARFDLVMPLLVWGYHRDPHLWIDSLARWEREGVRISNPPPVLRWNADKSYLVGLAEAGAPVVPTRLLERLTQEALADAVSAFGSEQLVAKPRASSTAWQTIRWRPGDAIDGGPQEQAIIQPYLPSIEGSGEISLLYFGGALSHAVRKRPQRDEFRVQPEYGGIITAAKPDADELAAAEQVLALVEESLLYARIDLVRGLDGSPQLIEMEAIEPDLYLGYDPRLGEAFANAVLSAAGR